MVADEVRDLAGPVLAGSEPMTIDEQLKIAETALKEILDVEKSANNGWNGLNNAVSIARRALERISHVPH